MANLPLAGMYRRVRRDIPTASKIWSSHPLGSGAGLLQCDHCHGWSRTFLGAFFILTFGDNPAKLCQ